MKTGVLSIALLAVSLSLIFAIAMGRREPTDAKVGYWAVDISQIEEANSRAATSDIGAGYCGPEPFAFDGKVVIVFFESRQMSSESGYWKLRAVEKGNDLYYLDPDSRWRFLATFNKRSCCYQSRENSTVVWTFKRTEVPADVAGAPTFVYQGKAD